eukprot:jgi/Ulvmu1/10994/UM007_0174.1
MVGGPVQELANRGTEINMRLSTMQSYRQAVHSVQHLLLNRLHCALSPSARCCVPSAAMCLGLFPSIKATRFKHLSPLPLQVSRRRVSASHFRDAQMSSSKRNSDVQANIDPELADRPMRRKRKVEGEALEGTAADGPIAGDVAGTSSPAPEDDTDEHQVARGQPLKDFVANWEFRWDVQRDMYPWEWGQGHLSEGPYNIIRYGQPPPKGWQRHN